MEKDFTQAIMYTAKALDAWLPYKIQYDHIPGLSVGIVHKGKLVYQRGFGYADVERQRKATTRTCYRIASISKTFTAIAILQLVEQGKISLDDKVAQYLPWFKAQTKQSDSRNISVRQLLSHGSGVFRDGTTPHWETGIFPSRKQLLGSISNKSLIFENLTRFKYSNFGFALLGEVIQKVSGLDYQRYVTKHIIKKLGMERTAPEFAQKNAAWLAKGYSRLIPGKDREVFPHWQTNAYAPATGFLSNVPDLAKLLAALSLKRKINLLLDKESKKEMMQPHWTIGGKGRAYGLGLNIDHIRERKIVGHGGGFAGFITQVRLDVENDIGVIALSNTNGSSSGDINTGIFESIYQFVDNISKYTSTKKIPGAQRFEGVYRSMWDDKIVVSMGSVLVACDPTVDSPIGEGDILKPKGKSVFELETLSEFDYPGEQAMFTFKRGASRAHCLIWGTCPSERLEE